MGACTNRTLCYLQWIAGAKSAPWTSSLIPASRRKAALDNADSLAGDIIGQEDDWDMSQNAGHMIETWMLPMATKRVRASPGDKRPRSPVHRHRAGHLSLRLCCRALRAAFCYQPTGAGAKLASADVAGCRSIQSPSYAHTARTSTSEQVLSIIKYQP